MLGSEVVLVCNQTAVDFRKKLAAVSEVMRKEEVSVNI